VGECFLAPGYSSEFMYIFLATDLSPDPLPGDDDEIIQIEKFSIPTTLEMAFSGAIQDSKTLTTLFLAQNRLADMKLGGKQLPK
jgi:ADP-ribose pyrophosphatase